MMAKLVGVSGDARLRLRVSAAGDVTDVQILKSIPLLDADAVKGARSWKFKAQSLAAADVDVTLRFDKRCGS
jgi:TonB family protein